MLVTLADTSTWTAGSLQFRKTLSIGGTPQSRIFRCGYGLDGPNADYYQVTMAMVARLQPSDAGSSTVRVGIAAGAKGTAAGNAEPVYCASEGSLEKRIADAVKKSREGIQAHSAARLWARVATLGQTGPYLTNSRDAPDGGGALRYNTDVDSRVSPADGTVPDPFSLLANLSYA